MAGTFAEQAELAASAELAVKVKAALIKNAAYHLDPAVVATLAGVKTFARELILAPDPWIQRFADIVAYGNATTAAAAPAVPTDQDTDYIVNVFFTRLAHPE
jgi:hypothetical protein